MIQKQEEIKFLLHTYGLKTTWLADKLNFKVRTLSYLLNESPTFDDDLYIKIKEIIDQHQMELNLFNEQSEENLDLFDEENLNLRMGERIRIFAKKKYGTLKGLADAMNISPQQLQQYISGNRDPGTKILVRLLKLGCDINWILGGREKAESFRLYKLETEFKKFQESFKQISDIVHKLESNL